MNAIDNANLIQMCRDCGAVGFLPNVTYAYDAEAGTVTVTNDSDIPDGDTLKRIKVRVHDFFAGEARGFIEADDDPSSVVIDVSDLDNSKGLAITVTITTVGMIAADGGAYGLSAAGNIGNWDVQKNA